MGNLKGQTRLGGVVIGFQAFQKALELTSCLDGKFSEAPRRLCNADTRWRFRPQPTVRGVFSDRTARVIALLCASFLPR